MQLQRAGMATQLARLRPFFCFFGGKWRAVPHYPAPRFRRIIEPFAGAAGYSTRYFEHDVVLVEKDPRIARLWRWLLAPRTTSDVILRLPLWGTQYESIDDPLFQAAVHDALVPGAFSSSASTSAADLAAAIDLIGFWMNKGSAQPHRRPSSWMTSGVRPRSHWGAEVRAIIAAQIARVKHWTVIDGDWTEAPDDRRPTTWFVDPLYQVDGKKYRCSAKDIDFELLGRVCVDLGQTQYQQVIVCENEGATWLPFRPFREIKAASGKQKKLSYDYTDEVGHKSVEVIWTNDT